MKFNGDNPSRSRFQSHVFVFGSNLAGRHGAGAAKTALKHWGAIYGRGAGLQGNSYAIPTKDAQLRVLSLDLIKRYVDEFLTYARHDPDNLFFVTAIGTGLAGYTHYEIAPMFKNAPDNCILPQEWKPILQDNANTKKTDL